eukprot:167051_1
MRTNEHDSDQVTLEDILNDTLVEERITTANAEQVLSDTATSIEDIPIEQSDENVCNNDNKPSMEPQLSRVATVIVSVDNAIKRELKTIESKQTNPETVDFTPLKTKKHIFFNPLFICYFLVCLYWGFLESLPGSLFNELIEQLNISEIKVSSIFLSRAVTFCVSSIITAYIIDKFISTHKYAFIILIISAICLSWIPFVNDVYIQYILWISLGFASGLIEVAIPVYTFRAFVTNSQKMWFILLTCYGIGKSLIPLIIQFFIELFDTFSYSLFFISFTALTACIFLFILSTPTHDEFRAIEKEMAKTNTLRRAQSVLQELEQHKTMRNVIIILFGIILIIFSIIQSGIVTFITLYVSEYLGVSDIMGRYLISTYYGGQLFYRFVIGFCLCDYIKSKLHSANHLFTMLIVYYVIYVLLFCVWIFCTIFNEHAQMGSNVQILILFIVFGCGGFVSSSTYPTIYELCETMYPINGVISCIFTMALGIGDMIIVVIMGELIKYFDIGIGVQPIPLIIVAIIQIIVIVIVVVLYNKYKSYESVILAAKT